MVGGHLDYVPLLFTQKGENWVEGKPKKANGKHINIFISEREFLKNNKHNS
jgi:hypothetical protein